MKILKSVSIPEADISIREDGIMHIHVKNELDVDIKQAYNMFEAAMELGEGEKYANLFTVSKLVTPNEESRNFMASKKRHKYVLADAFVIQSLPQRLIGNFYLRINRPPSPTRLFHDAEEAIVWLQQHISKARSNTQSNPTALRK